MRSLTDIQLDQLAEALERALNFQKDGDDFTWNCGHDHSLTVEILADMGLKQPQIDAAVDEFGDLGGHCDCEVFLNVICNRPSRPPSVRIVGPTRHESEPLGDSLLFVMWYGGESDEGRPLGWYFLWADSEPMDPVAKYHLLAGFPSREAAEERRQQWIDKDEWVTAIDDFATFDSVCELVMRERQKTARAKWKARKLKRRLSEQARRHTQPGQN